MDVNIYFSHSPSKDLIVHLGIGYDLYTIVAWRLFLHEGCVDGRRFECRLVAIGQFNVVRTLFLIGLRTHSMVDDGRNFARENSWFGCISGNRFQLDVHIHCHKIIRFALG